MSALPQPRTSTLRRLAAEVASVYVDLDPVRQDFMTETAATLRDMKGHDGADIRVKALQEIASYFCFVGKPFAALQPAETAVELAVASRQTTLQRRGFTLLGTALSETGNVIRAVECHGLAIELARAGRDIHTEAHAWINFAATVFHSGQYKQAHATLDHVLEMMSGRQEGGSLRTSALAYRALACLMLQNYDRGLDDVTQALQGLPEPKTQFTLLTRVYLEAMATRLHLELEQFPHAEIHARTASRYADLCRSPRAEIHALIASGLHQTMTGRFDAGIAILTRAMERATAEVQSLSKDAISALIQAYQLAGRPHKAVPLVDRMKAEYQRQQQESALRCIRESVAHLGQGSFPEFTFGERLEYYSKALDAATRDHVAIRGRLVALENMARTAELAKQPDGSHCYRVGKLAGRLAAQAGLPAQACKEVDVGARLHDIGIAMVPQNVRDDPELDRELFRSHALQGETFLKRAQLHQTMACSIARSHHERWDGAGYPDQLKGEEIPLPARITAICEVFDRRIHQHGETWQQALAEVNTRAGFRFDPKLVGHFEAMLQEIEREEGGVAAFLDAANHDPTYFQAQKHIAELFRPL